MSSRIHTLEDQPIVPIEDYWFVVEAGEQAKDWVVKYQGDNEYAVFELGEQFNEDEWNCVEVNEHADRLCDGRYFKHHADCPHVEAVRKVEEHELDRTLAMLRGSKSRDLL